jgi:hypothetical protein
MLPYGAGVALARMLARHAPLYSGTAAAGLRRWQEVMPGGDASAWRAAYRFAQLIDHADLFWALTRSRNFLARRLEVADIAATPGKPLLVLSFHYGQGLFLLNWLAAHGHAPRFVSMRLARMPGQSRLEWAYACLRISIVRRLATVAPIYTGGARREIAGTLAAGGTVYGLVDVPMPDATSTPANAKLRGRPVLLASGLLEAASGAGAPVLVLTACARGDGSRVVEARAFPSVESVTLDDLAAALDTRLERAPAAWHFWHLWPSFERDPA